MEASDLVGNLTTAEVMNRWPMTIPIFIRHCMACVGCPIAPFETLAEVASIYNLNLDSFMQELLQAIDSAEGQMRLTIL